MKPRVKSVKADKNYTLIIAFNNGESKVFDVKPYLTIGRFVELKDYAIFNSVKEYMGSILWANGLDLCPDTLYIESDKMN